MKHLELDLMASGLLTKKEIEKAGEAEAQVIMDEGWENATDYLVHSKRIITFLTSFNKGLDYEVRATVERNGGKTDVNGAALSLGSTGERLNYKDDPIWADLKKKMADREALIKMRFKTKNPFYDIEGIEVPLVSLASASRETLTVKY